MQSVDESVVGVVGTNATYAHMLAFYLHSPPSRCRYRSTFYSKIGAELTFSRSPASHARTCVGESESEFRRERVRERE